MNTIILIDTDVAFLDRLKLKLREEELTDKYNFHLLCPDTTIEKRALIKNCVHEVNSIMFTEPNVVGIFVDIVIVEGGKTLDRTGIEIAAELRNHYPNLPIFNITAKYSDEEYDTDIISAASLEDSDGILIKSYLEGKYFSAKRLKTIFEKAKAKRSKYVRPTRAEVPHKSELPANTRQAYNVDSLDPRVKSQIEELGAAEFWSLLMMLLPQSQGRVSYMRPGRSGAFIFKVLAKFSGPDGLVTVPKSWVLKISTQPGELERELSNYAEMVKTPFSRVSYPRPLGNNLRQVGNLAGFIIELESGADSLLNTFRTINDEDLSSIVETIRSFISETYGEPVKRLCNVWTDCYPITEQANLIIQSVLEDNRSIFQSDNQTRFLRILNFLKTSAALEEKVLDCDVNADLRIVHGDFNARNLLVNENHSLVVIDFASRAQGHVAKDIAKLERDIVFRVLDVNSREYFDWTRIDEWRHFLGLIEKEKIFSWDEQSLKSTDDYMNKAISFIMGIRMALKQEVPHLTEREYVLALLHYSLLAIGHPEVSIQKKLFGLEYIDSLLDSL